MGDRHADHEPDHGLIPLSDRALAHLRLPHATPIIFVLTATAVLAFVLSDGLTASRLGLTLAAMFGAQVVIGVVNELVDLPLDRETKPTKPLASGLVSLRGAWVMLIVSTIVMVAAGAALPAGAFVLCLLGCGVGVGYSIWFKRTVVAWVPYVVALPMLPLYVATAVEQFDTGLLLLYPLGAIAAPAVHIAQALPDVAADRAAGLRTVTTATGESKGIHLLALAMFGSAGLVVVAGWGDALPLIAGIAACLAGAVLLVGYRIRPRTAVLAAFPIAAGSTALLGAAWVYATGT